MCREGCVGHVEGRRLMSTRGVEDEIWYLLCE